MLKKDNFIKNIIFEYLRNKSQKEHLFYQFSVKDQTIDLKKYLDDKLNFKKTFIKEEFNEISLSSVEELDIQKLTAIYDYLIDYNCDEKQSKLANFLSYQKELIHELLNNNNAGNFGLENNILLRKNNYKASSSNLGKLCSDKVSVQYLSKELQVFLLGSNYQNYQNYMIENTRFSILADTAVKFKLSTPAIFNYIKNKNLVLSEKMIRDNISLEEAENRILSSLNTNKYNGFYTDFIINDVKIIKNYLFENFLPQYLKLNNNKQLFENFFLFYIQITETRILLELYNFLEIKIKELYEKNITPSHPLFFYIAIHDKSTNFISFIPSNQNVFIKISSGSLNLYSSDIISDFNDMKENSGSYIKFKKVPDLIKFEYIDIEILTKYYLIRKLLLRITMKQFNLLLLKYNIKPYMPDTNIHKFENFNSLRDYINSLKVQSTNFRYSIYKNLLKHSISELENYNIIE